MNTRSWFKYLGYILLIGGVIFLKEYVTHRIEVIWSRTWGAGINYLFLLLVPFAFNILIGMLLGLEHLLKELRVAGKMRLNLPKLLLMGIPSMFFSLFYLFALIENPAVTRILRILVTNGTYYIPVFQVIVGFVIITSLYKSKVEDTDCENKDHAINMKNEQEQET